MTVELTEQTSIIWSTEETTLEDQTLLFVNSSPGWYLVIFWYSWIKAPI